MMNEEEKTKFCRLYPASRLPSTDTSNVCAESLCVQTTDCGGGETCYVIYLILCEGVFVDGWVTHFYPDRIY